MYEILDVSGLDNSNNTKGAQELYMSPKDFELLHDAKEAVTGLNCAIRYADSPNFETEKDVRRMREWMKDMQVFILGVTEKFIRSMEAGNTSKEFLAARKFLIPIIAIADNDDLLQSYHRITRTADGISKTDRYYRKKFRARIEEHLVSKDNLPLQKRAFEYVEKAQSYFQKVDYKQSIECLTKAYDIKEQLHVNAPPCTDDLCCNIGLCYAEMYNFKMAYEWFSKTLELNKKYRGNENPHTAYTYRLMGQTNRELGKIHESLECLLHSFVIYYNSLGGGHEDTDLAARMLGSLFVENIGNPEEFSVWMKKRTGLSMEYHPE